jgi:hypothetical protein
MSWSVELKVSVQTTTVSPPALVALSELNWALRVVVLTVPGSSAPSDINCRPSSVSRDGRRLRRAGETVRLWERRENMIVRLPRDGGSVTIATVRHHGNPGCKLLLFEDLGHNFAPDSATIVPARQPFMRRRSRKHVRPLRISLGWAASGLAGGYAVRRHP